MVPSGAFYKVLLKPIVMETRFFHHKKRSLPTYWILLFLLSFNYTAHSQLYLDLSVNYDFYQFDEPLNLQNDKVIFLPRIGVTAFQSANKKFKLSGETGPFYREFDQNFPGHKFRYRFAGWMMSPVGSYQAFENLYLDAGINVLFYNARINGKGLTTPIGRGFRGYNIGFIAGGSYYLAEWFAVGIRYTPYFVKMLEYERIGAYGDFEPSKKDISTQRLELFIRFQILNSMNK